MQDPEADWKNKSRQVVHDVYELQVKQLVKVLGQTTHAVELGTR
jgi:hypothetical protein